MNFDDFSVSVPSRVQALTQSFNRILRGIVPAGIQQGFGVSLAGGLMVDVGVAGDESTATVGSGKYLLTVQAIGIKTITLPIGSSTIVVEAIYIDNQPTTFDVKQIPTGNVTAEHVILADFVIPPATVTIAAGMMDLTRRFNAGFAKASQVLTNVPLGAKFTDTVRAISNSVTSTSTSTSASSAAVKTAYDKGDEAMLLINSARVVARGLTEVAGGGKVTIVIPAVDMDKSFIIDSYLNGAASLTASGSPHAISGTARLISATQVEVEGGKKIGFHNSVNPKVNWTVLTND